MNDGPELLLATTTWWPSLAVLACAFEQAGFRVTMLCPRGHIAWQARRFACRELDRRRPAASLLSALEAVSPTLVVPGDERVVELLRELHLEYPGLRATIESAIGHARSHPLLTARVPLLRAAAEAGFATPHTRTLASAPALEAWLAELPAPWVFKIDGAWGGEGVRIVAEPAEARRAVRMLGRGVPLRLALRRKIVNGDPFPWEERRARRPIAVSAQAFVPGRPGNCAVFALGGRVLGATVVEAVATCGDHGPSVLVRAVDRPEVVNSAGRLVARLGLSGFLGFDVVVGRDGTAVLIEMNPRVTMPCRMQGPFGPAPIDAAAQACGAVPRPGAPGPMRSIFASFPLAWLADPFAPALASCSDDLPWSEPGMLRDGLRPLWPERGILASLPSRVRALRDRLHGVADRDHRHHSFAWWLDQGGLAASRRAFLKAASGRHPPTVPFTAD